MNVEMIKRYILPVVITTVVILVAIILTMRSLIPTWCNDTSYLSKLIVKSPIVLMEMKGRPILVDVRDIYLNEEIESTTNSGIPALLGRIISKGDRVIIIGDGAGYYSMMIGDLIGKRGKIFLFQPNGDNNRLVEYNLKMNDMWDYVSISNKMPYSTNSKVLIENFTNSLHAYRVLLNVDHTSDYARLTNTIEAVRIDDVLKGQSVNFIKLHCYGAEIKSLLGAVRTIQNSSRVSIMMQWNPEAMKYYGDILPFINNMMYLGFEFWSISDSGVKELLTKNRLLREQFDNVLITKETI